MISVFAWLEPQFQSTHPVRGATRGGVESGQHQSISIHAPREGCDQRTTGRAHIHRISIHAPREGCDPCWSTAYGMRVEFQSTHPVRGATVRAATAFRALRKFQSTHPVRGATSLQPPAPSVALTFQSTHPVRGATDRQTPVQRCRAISIHAPREGCDPGHKHGRRLVSSISIHAPREGCDAISVLMLSGRSIFQSTHPGRGATEPPW